MIIIIGAGPIGCFLGGLLAKKGKEVAIYEEHSSIGKPVQCTGIVTKEIGKILEIKDEFLINEVKKVKVYSKNRKTVIPIDDIVINREKFDKYLAKKAKKYGAKIYLSHKFLGIRNNNPVFADKNNKVKKVDAEYIVGADGPLSEVAKSNNMFHNKKFYFGMQARVKGKYDPECYEIYLGSVCDDFFSWVLPESKTIARIGIASKKRTREKFKKFFETKGIKKKSIIDYQAGLIPIFNKNSIIQKGKVLLVGDAAGQVKATTGGGLVPGMKSAKILAKCILNGKNYEKEIKNVGKELQLHIKIRKVLDKFSDKDYNKLLKTMNNKKIKSLFKQYNRDGMKKLFLKLLLTKPSLLSYIKNFIK